MIIVVEGTKTFDNYELFMRGMGVAMSAPDIGNEIQVWSLGPHKINHFTAGFCNLSSRYLKGVGKKIRFSKVTYDWAKQNLEYIDYYAFFSLPKEPLSKFADWIQHKETVEVGIFRF